LRGAEQQQELLEASHRTAAVGCRRCVVVVGCCMTGDRRDGAVIRAMGGVHASTLSVGGSHDIGAAP
jgi:hypothetical protein